MSAHVYAVTKVPIELRIRPCVGSHRTEYKAVTLGTVEQIDLADVLAHVIVKLHMSVQLTALLTDEARFWVARPRLGGGLSAVETGRGDPGLWRVRCRRPRPEGFSVLVMVMVVVVVGRDSGRGDMLFTPVVSFPRCLLPAP